MTDADGVWLTETLHHGFRTSIRVDRILYDNHTEHQHLVVAETSDLGTMFMLDGVTQLTTADEYVYHEMLAHVPILAHGGVRDVLVVGGGDGGMIEEILKHRTVERVTLVEIDPGVIEFARTYLPDVSGNALDDPRLRVVIADGQAFVAARAESADPADLFDLIVVDSTDPIGPGEVLFTPEFYGACRDVLAPDGLLVTQNGVPFFQPEELEATIRAFAGLFSDATCYLAAVPTYVGGFMAFGWGTNDPDHRRRPLATLESRFSDAAIATRYYTPEVHVASFALPRFILDIVERGRAG